jgi:hypothetical protein
MRKMELTTRSTKGTKRIIDGILVHFVPLVVTPEIFSTKNDKR